MLSNASYKIIHCLQKIHDFTQAGFIKSMQIKQRNCIDTATEINNICQRMVVIQKERTDYRRSIVLSSVTATTTSSCSRRSLVMKTESSNFQENRSPRNTEESVETNCALIIKLHRGEHWSIQDTGKKEPRCQLHYWAKKRSITRN